MGFITPNKNNYCRCYTISAFLCSKVHQSHHLLSWFLTSGQSRLTQPFHWTIKLHRLFVKALQECIMLPCIPKHHGLFGHVHWVDNLHLFFLCSSWGCARLWFSLLPLFLRKWSNSIASCTFMETSTQAKLHTLCTYAVIRAASFSASMLDNINGYNRLYSNDDNRSTYIKLEWELVDWGPFTVAKEGYWLQAQKNNVPRHIQSSLYEKQTPKTFEESQYYTQITQHSHTPENILYCI